MVDGIQEFINAIKTPTAETSKTYSAVVSKVDKEGTVWVRVAGSNMETPTKLSSSEVESGDSVNVEWRNNRLYIAGNVSNPAVGTIRVDAVERATAQARNAANSAVSFAVEAQDAASTAIGYATQAKETVEELESSVESLEGRVDTAEGKITTIEGDIQTLESDVSTAKGNITTIQGDITTLQGDVSTAQSNITTIQGNITTLQSDVSTAQGNITTIQGDITTLQQDVSNAQDDIDDAIEGLALAENVIGTLNWLTAHSTVTDDTTPVSGKSYYIKHQDGTFEIVTDTTGKNPHQQGWYEMDSAISNYVGAHLALTDYGLNLTLDNNSYRIHIGTLTASGDDGVYVIDGDGNVVTYFGESISFDSDYPFRIGNENNYILWNPTQNRIEIGGNVMMGSNKTLSEVLAEIDGNLVFDTTYTVSERQSDQHKVALFTAHVYKGGVDVAQSEYEAGYFTWYLKRELTEAEALMYTDGLIPIGNPNTGFTKEVDITTCGYGAEVIARFTTPTNATALNHDGDTITDVDNNDFTVRATGDSVRVRDLTVSTTIYPTDKLMVVGGEDEHLISIQTLQDYLNANLDKQVLFNTTAGWNSQTTLVSELNTLYVYTDHQTDSQGNSVAGIKAGDGNAYVVDLPFTDAIATEHIADTTMHITNAERTAWNNKVRCYYAGTENLIFTTA